MADFLGDHKIGERGLWGYTAQDLASQEAQRQEGAARGVNAAFSSIMQRVGEMREEAPDLPPDQLFRRLLWTRHSCKTRSTSRRRRCTGWSRASSAPFSRQR